MKTLIAMFVGIILLSTSTTTQPQVSSVAQTTTNTRNTTKTNKKPSKAPKKPQLDPVKDNPKNCDQETQWVWTDFTCHDKVNNVPNPVSPHTSSGGSCESYRSLVSQYDWDTETMMRIMQAESGCNPTNHNWGDDHKVCLGSYGLLQIGCVHGYSVDYLSNPAGNIAVAYNIWSGQGYTAWTTY